MTSDKIAIEVCHTTNGSTVDELIAVLDEKYKGQNAHSLVLVMPEDKSTIRTLICQLEDVIQLPEGSSIAITIGDTARYK